MSEEKKDLGGRPPIYSTPEELEALCNEYFKQAEGEYEEVTKIDDDGKKYKERIYSVPEEKITITGLALYLGFCSRSTLYEYEKKEGFSYIIKKAQMVVPGCTEIPYCLEHAPFAPLLQLLAYCQKCGKIYYPYDFFTSNIIKILRYPEKEGRRHL